MKNVDRTKDPIRDIFKDVYGYNAPYTPMTADLKDRVAIITGATGMIGGAAADLFAASGAKVIITGRKDDIGAEKVKEITDKGGFAQYYHVDLFKEEDVKNLVDSVVAEHGRVDILVANAGSNWSSRKPLPYFDEDLYDKNIDANLNIGSIYIAQQVIPHMIKQGGGNIMFTSSICGVTGLRLQSGFVASKFAISAITKSMAIEYGKYNIRVNTLAPGSLPNPDATVNFLWDTCDFDDYDKNFENPHTMVFDIPARRPAYPSDMAGILLYLASDDACYTTGQVICVDGGWTAGLSGLY